MHIFVQIFLENYAFLFLQSQERLLRLWFKPKIVSNSIFRLFNYCFLFVYSVNVLEVVLRLNSSYSIFTWPFPNPNILDQTYCSFNEGDKPRQPCSIRCEGVQGRVPTLQCRICLCLYHHECIGISTNQTMIYICKVCTRFWN